MDSNGMRCKEKAKRKCRKSISDLAALFPIECKDVDPRYKIVHDLSDSCASEYSFTAVSYCG